MLNTINLNWIDVILLAVLGFAIIRGLIRGFIRSIFDILALAIAIYCAFIWYKGVAIYLSNNFKMPDNLAIIGFFAIWIAAYCIVLLIGNMIHMILGRGIFGPINAIGGGLIGATKGILIIWFFVALISIFSLPKDIAQPIHDSTTIKILTPIFEQSRSTLSPLIPEFNKSSAKKQKINKNFNIKKGSVGI